MKTVSGLVDKIYDTVIVGSGPAGYAAAVYAARAGLGTLLFQGFESGGQPILASKVENYPGYPGGVSGPEMMYDFETQAARFGMEMRPDDVERVDLSKRPFRLWPEAEEPTLARTVVIATGGKAKWLGLEGERRFMGKGVSGCATCDAFFYRNGRVAVVGGGDTAIGEALVLSGFADEVFVIHRRGAFRASEIMVNEAKNNPKITFVTDTVVEEILGEGCVEGVELRTPGSQSRTLRIDRLFVAVGQRPASDLFRDQVETDEDGYVIRRQNAMTSVPGVFAAGEVADKDYRQIATAVGSGCMAAMDAKRWLEAGPRYP